MSTVVTITHRQPATGSNNPAFDVSKNAWNDTLVVDSAAPDGAVLVVDSAQPDGIGATVLTKTNVGLGNVENVAMSTGNAATATQLATPRALNGVPFDGTAAITVPIKKVVVTLTDGATPALNAALGDLFDLVAAGDRAIAVPTNPVDGKTITIRHKASGGARTLTLNAGAGGFRFGTDPSALTATSSGKTDYIGCQYNAADGFWDVLAVSKGF